MMDKIREFVENRQAATYRALELDKKYVNDAYNGQFMRGRVAVEERVVEDFETILKMLDE